MILLERKQKRWPLKSTGNYQAASRCEYKIEMAQIQSSPIIRFHPSKVVKVDIRKLLKQEGVRYSIVDAILSTGGVVVPALDVLPPPAIDLSEKQKPVAIEVCTHVSHTFLVEESLCLSVINKLTFESFIL